MFISKDSSNESPLIGYKNAIVGLFWVSIMQLIICFTPFDLKGGLYLSTIFIFLVGIILFTSALIFSMLQIANRKFYNQMRKRAARQKKKAAGIVE